MRLTRQAFIFALLLVLSGTALAVDVVVMGLFRDKAIVRIDNKQRILTLGKRSPEGVLLISSNSSEAVIEIDGKRQTLGLSSQISTGFKRDSQPSVSIYLTRGMFQAVGSINGFPVNFLVDTGATYVVMNRNEARRLGIDYRQHGKQGYASTANGIIRTWEITLNRVQVGDVLLTNVKGAVNEGDSPREVLLGMSFLGRLEMKNDGTSMLLRKKF